MGRFTQKLKKHLKSGVGKAIGFVLSLALLSATLGGMILLGSACKDKGEDSSSSYSSSSSDVGSPDGSSDGSSDSSSSSSSESSSSEKPDNSSENSSGNSSSEKPDNSSSSDPSDGDVSHKHTYANEWSKSITAHWKVATCCDGEKAELDGHYDGDKDGDCDVCGYVDETHTHVYKDVWSSDTNGHWKDAICGHVLKSETGTHTPNEIGDCNVCGYHVTDPDVSSLEKAIALAYSQRNNIASGIMEWNYKVYDEVQKAYGHPSYTNLSYELSPGYKKELSVLYGWQDSETFQGWTKTISQNWYYRYDNGIIGLCRDEQGNVTRINDTLGEDVLKGYNFSGTYLDFGYQNGVNGGYGLEEYMRNLYEYIQLETDANYLGGTDGILDIINVQEAAENGKYTLTFVYLSMRQAIENGVQLNEYYAAEYTTVALEFSLTDDYLIGDMSIEVSVYNGNSIQSNGNNINGNYSLKANAIAARVSSYNFRQSSEEVEPFDLEKMFASSFDIESEDGSEILEDGAAISVVRGQYNYHGLTVKNIEPTTVDLSFDRITVSILKDGVEIEDMNLATGFYSNDNGKIMFYITEVGEYELLVKSYNVTKTFTVKVTYAETDTFYASAYVNGGWTEQGITTAEIYEGDFLRFKANVNPYAQDTMNGVITTSANGSTNAELMYDESSGEYVFYPDAVGTYTLTFTSTAASQVAGLTASVFVVTVIEEIDPSELLTGVYELDLYDTYNTAWVVTFGALDDSQKEDGIYSGEVEIQLSWQKNVWGTITSGVETCVFTYVYDGIDLTLTLVSGDNTVYSANAWNLYIVSCQLRVMSATNAVYTLEKTTNS